MSGDKETQVKQLAVVLTRMIPPAVRIAHDWAAKLYDQGVRIHPELADPAAAPQQQQPTIPPPQQQQQMLEQAMATLREMSERWPYLRPLVQRVESARTPQERAAALEELRAQTQPAVLAEAERQIEKLDDNTE